MKAQVLYSSLWFFSVRRLPQLFRSGQKIPQERNMSIGTLEPYSANPTPLALRAQTGGRPQWISARALGREGAAGVAKFP